MQRINFARSTAALALISLFVATANSIGQDKFKGRVLSQSDQPVVGASVLLVESHLFRPGPRIHEQSVSDADGEFSLPIVGDKKLVGIIYKPGFGISLTSFSDRTVWGGIEQTEPVSNIKLPDAKSLSVKINDSVGNPAKIIDARVSSLELTGSSTWELGNASDVPLPVKINGNAVSVDWLSEGVGLRLHLQTEKDVSQDIYVPFEAEIPESIQLVGTSKLSGTVSPSKNSKVIPRDARVTLNVVNPPYASGQPTMVRMVFRDTIDLDSEGKYEWNAMAGSAQVTLFDGRSNWGADSKAVLLELGKSQTQDLVMHELWTIRGRCIDEEGKPIQGVRFASDSDVVSNENGQFEFYRPANQSHYSITAVPDGYLLPLYNWRGLKAEKNVTEYELPDIVLRKAMPFSGKVVDPAGAPVANATVYAVWHAREGRSGSAKGQIVNTNDQGKFTLTKADKFDVRLSAEVDAMASNQAQIITLNDRNNVVLTISPAGKVAFSGVITDYAGQPIADATIQLNKQIVVPGTNFVYGHRPVLQNQSVKTNASGRFQYPIKLRRSEQYKMMVEAKGFVGEEVSNLTIPETGDIEVSDIKLKATRSAQGVVVDTAGNPISGVRVWSHGISPPNQHQPNQFRDQVGSGIATDTKEDGRFQIVGIHGDAKFLFASKEGYRMTGMLLNDNGEFRIELPENHQPGEPLKFKRIDAEAKRKQLRRILGFVRSMGDKPSSYQLGQELDVMLAADPESLIESIEQLEFGYNKAPWLAAAGHHEDAYETCIAMQTPYWRVSALTACASRTNDRDNKTELLKEAGFRLKNLADMRRRVEMASSIIDDLMDLGHYELARDIADYVTPIALGMNLEGRNEFSKAWYGKALARLDNELAWELIKDSRDTGNSSSGGFDRHAGNMAHELAASDPEKSIQLLNEIPERGRARYVQRVAARMAPVDSDRAVELMDSCQGGGSNAKYVANGYGSLAMQLNETAPARAKELLQNGFDRLFNSSNQLNDRFNFGCPINLLRFESKIQKSYSPNFWRVVEAFADPNLTGYWGNNRQREALLRRAKLALILELFDREPQVCDALLDPVFEYFANPPVENKSWSQGLTDHAAVFAAMALNDPERAVTTHEAFYQKLPERERGYIPMAWVVIARTLASDPDELVDYLADLSYTWIIGQED